MSDTSTERKISKFTRSKAQPDANREEWSR